MVGAEAAIVGAAELDGGVEVLRHLGWFEEDFAAAAVVGHIVGHEDAGEAVLRTALEHEGEVVFEDDFGVNAAEAGGAEGDGGVVEEVGAGGGGHGLFVPLMPSIAHATREVKRHRAETTQIHRPQPESGPPNSD